MLNITRQLCPHDLAGLLSERPVDSATPAIRRSQRATVITGEDRTQVYCVDRWG